MPAERSPWFPNPDLAPRLVLFPIAGGGVALDWSLDPALIQQARFAFAAHQPVAKLYLRRADPEGACLAEATLSDLSSDADGSARFEAPVVGALQAELGFEGQRDGGWMLLARSNRLEAVPASSGLETGAVSAGVESALKVEPEPGPEITRSTGQLPQAPSAPASLDLITPEPGLREIAQATPGARALVGQPLPAQSPGAAAAGLVTRFPDLSLRSLADRPELYGCPIPLVAVEGVGRRGIRGSGRATSISTSADALARSDDRLVDDSGDQLSGHLKAGNLKALASAANTLSDLEPDTASEQVLLDQEPPNRQDVVSSGMRASRGSGPLSPYPSGEGAVINGELRVFGSAAPGSLLDLGGHPFRVGPGGRFSFRVPVDDADLLTSLLVRLPRLPVDERET